MDLYRDISYFMEVYRPRTYIVKNEKGNLVADFFSIMASWTNHFSQLLNVHGVNNVRPTEIYTAELLVPESSTFEFTMANLKFSSLCDGFTQAQFIQAYTLFTTEICKHLGSHDAEKLNKA